jgi:phospholipase/carboxylesterase
MAAARVLLHPVLPDAAMPLRPMVPLIPSVLRDLGGRRVLIVSGIADQIAPQAEGDRLASLLRRGGRAVRSIAVPSAAA